MRTCSNWNILEPPSQHANEEHIASGAPGIRATSPSFLWFLMVGGICHARAAIFIRDLLDHPRCSHWCSIRHLAHLVACWDACWIRCLNSLWCPEPKEMEIGWRFWDGFGFKMGIITAAEAINKWNQLWRRLQRVTNRSQIEQVLHL